MKEIFDKYSYFTVVDSETNLVSERYLMSKSRALEKWRDITTSGYRLVRCGSYPCGENEDGYHLFPVFEILEVRH